MDEALRRLVEMDLSVQLPAEWQNFAVSLFPGERGCSILPR